ncbi:MAG: 23S rRNA methyltransferase [Alphaproteobacteria bacterium]|nr:23S rRNA methyltransferase [Alphaproteobacteria bacterium]
MARRPPAKSGQPAASPRGVSGHASAKRAPKRTSNLKKADTALGAPAEKRGLKKSSAKGKVAGKPGGKTTGKKVSGDEASAGVRGMRQNVMTGRYRKHSSTLWLDRQLNDPYVQKAKAEGFRSRAAFKLIELDDKYAFLRRGASVVDLGCAPGGWLQVAARRGAGKVVGIDYLHTPAVAGSEILEMDFLDVDAPAKLKAALGGPADVVLSDMAAPTTGHKATDHLRVVALAEAAVDYALEVLKPGGAFACKVFAGGAEGELLDKLKRNFRTVKHAKPKASRSESSEKYVVALGFRGAAASGDETP